MLYDRLKSHRLYSSPDLSQAVKSEVLDILRGELDDGFHVYKSS